MHSMRDPICVACYREMMANGPKPNLKCYKCKKELVNLADYLRAYDINARSKLICNDCYDLNSKSQYLI